MPERSASRLVLLPGWGFDGQVFSDLVVVLEEQFNRRITMLDFPGYGDRKNIVVESGLDAIVEPMLPLLSVNTVLIGWSLGGMAAIRMAKPAARVTSAPMDALTEVNSNTVIVLPERFSSSVTICPLVASSMVLERIA